ncbi:uncharacterized mitochondrial protein AtMg00310-like [Hibiscus syriacus]|uniref:uncharacterized mitochondrial protein AtMg00310-like n=1 Tax=Hibiscus syriacus TaxID=106335 RepID=UPI001923341E|nr:uncharacterized mitochondrial protein AtMg00310-like [Hibiscus syriacus]
MSLYALPAFLCRELNSVIAQFWWRSDASTRVIHWLGMSERLPKSIGGLGIRDLEVLNQAFLCKQGWSLIHESNSLVAWVLKAKYFLHGSFLTAELGSQPTFCWRSIWSVRGVVKEGLRAQVGDRTTIPVYSYWVPQCTPAELLHSCVAPNCLTWVSDLIYPSLGTWRTNVVETLFQAPVARAILSIPLHVD